MYYSIIIPTSNEEKYIGKLLKCLKNQTFKGFEVIIVDADSKDNTKLEALKYKKDFKRFKFIIDKVKGVGRARNVGAKEAKGDYFVFFDCDGSFDKDLLELAYIQIQRRKLNTTGCYVRPTTSNIFIKLFFIFYNFIIWLFQYFYPLMPGFCIFCDRKTFFKIKGFDEKILLAEDYDLVRRASKIGKFRVLKNLRINTSTRRFEEEGIIRLTTKYVIVFFYRIFVGEVKTDRFKYKLGYHEK